MMNCGSRSVSVGQTTETRKYSELKYTEMNTSNLKAYTVTVG